MAGYDGWRRGRPNEEGWRNAPYPLRPPFPPTYGGHEGGGGFGAGRPHYDTGYAPDPRGRDEAIRQAVRRNLFEDTWLDARNIDIEVENGVVTLRGEVRKHLEARYAWDDAWETEGVRGVISRLEVEESTARRGEGTEGKP